MITENFKSTLSSARFTVYTAVVIQKLLLCLYLFVGFPVLLILHVLSAESLVETLMKCKEVSLVWLANTYGTFVAPLIFFLIVLHLFLGLINSQQLDSGKLLTTLNKKVLQADSIQAIRTWENNALFFLVNEYILFVNLLFHGDGTIIKIIVGLVIALRCYSVCMIAIYKKQFDTETTGETAPAPLSDDEILEELMLEVSGLSLRRIEARFMKFVESHDSTGVMKKILSFIRVVVFVITPFVKTVTRGLTIMVAFTALMVVYMMTAITTAALYDNNGGIVTNGLSSIVVWPFRTTVTSEETFLTARADLIKISIFFSMLMWIQVRFAMVLLKTTSHKVLPIYNDTRLFNCLQVIGLTYFVSEYRAYLGRLFLELNVVVMSVIVIILVFRWFISSYLASVHSEQLVLLAKLTNKPNDIVDDEEVSYCDSEDSDCKDDKKANHYHIDCECKADLEIKYCQIDCEGHVDDKNEYCCDCENYV